MTEELPCNAYEEVSSPACLGHIPISVTGDKSTDSPGQSPFNVVRSDSPACLGLPDLILPTSSGQTKTSVFGCMYPVIVPDDHLATIAGMGDDCGLIDRFSKRRVVCQNDPNHIHFEVGGSSCGKPDCPRHWKTWARRGSDRVGCIVWGYKEASKGRRDPRHTILSVKDTDPVIAKRSGKTDRENLIYFRNYFVKQALSKGGIGGSMVVHLWRTNDDMPDWVEDSTRWDWIRKKPNWRDFVKFSPHAHVIGYGFYTEPEKGDFSYKNFPSLKDRDAVESVAFYQLSHAPVGIGNAVIYWGCCQSGFLKVVSRGKEHVSVYCQVCNGIAVYEDCGEEYLRKRSWAIYEIVKPPPRKKKVPGESKKRISANALRIWGPIGPLVHQ